MQVEQDQQSRHGGQTWWWRSDAVQLKSHFSLVNEASERDFVRHGNETSLSPSRIIIIGIPRNDHQWLSSHKGVLLGRPSWQ